MNDPDSLAEDLDELHQAGVVTDAEFSDETTRLPSPDTPVVVVQPPQDAPPAPDPTSAPTTPPEPTEPPAEAPPSSDAGQPPADQELAERGALHSGHLEVTQTGPDEVDVKLVDDTPAITGGSDAAQA